MNIHKSQLFWGSLGTRVLTHPQMGGRSLWSWWEVNLFLRAKGPWGHNRMTVRRCPYQSSTKLMDIHFRSDLFHHPGSMNLIKIHKVDDKTMVVSWLCGTTCFSFHGRSLPPTVSATRVDVSRGSWRMMWPAPVSKMHLTLGILRVRSHAKRKSSFGIFGDKSR